MKKFIPQVFRSNETFFRRCFARMKKFFSLVFHSQKEIML